MLHHAVGRRTFSSKHISSKYIQDLFMPQTAEFVAAAGSIPSIPPSMRLPEVVVTGRANVGKSALLNTVMKRKALVASGKKPGRTHTLTFFRVGSEPGKLILVDAPGYGPRGRPEWGELFDRYVDTRRELCRVYILLNAKHGTSEADRMMLRQLDEKVQSGVARWTLQAIITKADLVSSVNLDAAVKGIQQTIFENAPTCLPPIVTASGGIALGADDVRRSMVEACGLAR